ncbi:MAG: OmpA family protein [Myxococcales bacterium]|jgi:outer membrane protein OmpA-like peptidoglycan-associated protein|nr:OmpA family protein [Myxococcales bacterium]
MRSAIRIFTATLVCVPCLAFVVGGCVSGSALRARGQVIQAEVDRARANDAYRCAPRELALAEAHLDFADGEYSEGNSLRAQEHMDIAEKNAREAVYLSRDCGPKKVFIAEAPPVLRIEHNDRDGDGIPDNEDACPDVPGLVENRGCPVITDTDGDGIPDDVDRCPTNAEDVDGFEDEDGCPDPDNDGDRILDIDDACPHQHGVPNSDPKQHGCPDRDGDRILDIDDACPDEPGVPSSDPKQHGCPVLDRDGDGILDEVDACPDQPGIPDADPKKHGCPRKLKMVIVKEDKIEIRQQINFATGKSLIRGAKSFQILDEVVLVLSDNPRIKKLSVEGHTDSTGKATMNKKLSQARAEAVVDYLVSRGVDPSRLDAMGFGPDNPIATNKTAAGRAKNRRTEFNIVQQ